MFYTNEDWELLDPNPKELEESMAQEERKKPAPEGSRGMDMGTCFLSPILLSVALAVPETPRYQAFLEAGGPLGIHILSVGDEPQGPAE